MQQQSTDFPSDAPDALMEMLAGCARQNEQAFTKLYQVSSARIFAVLLRSLSVRSYAEEALQNTYTTIWQTAKDYRTDRGSPMLWMLAIAREEARKIASDYQVWQTSLKESDLEPIAPVSLPEILSQLDTPSQQCIVALYCEGPSLQALAAKTSEPADDIRNRVRRFLQLMSESDDEPA